MRKKDLYNMIRTKAMNDIPDILPKINLDNIEIIPAEEKAKKHFSFAKLMSFSLTFAVIAIVAVFGINFLISEPTPNYLPLSSDAEIIGYQAVSATILTQEYYLDELSYEILPLADSDEDLLISSLDTVDMYLGMFEYTLGDEDNVSFQYIESDQPQYQYCIEFSGLDLMKNQTYLYFYYNASVANGSTEVDGIISTDDGEIAITGNIFANENAVRSTFRAFRDDENYVEIQNRSTEQKQTFHYEIVENGVAGKKADVSVEAVKNRYRANIRMTEANGTLTMTVGKDKGNSKFAITYQASGTSDISGEIEVSVEYDETAGKYIYAYAVSQNGKVTIYHGRRTETPASSIGPDNHRNTTIPGPQNSNYNPVESTDGYAV
ncbi:MAG TPA: hypothetical protein PLH02_05185 [Bacillota bacterium]|nr:hypothetical protein [Bacillota bacterium]HPF43022.1 hypothetical protein [Bacillota bacterium]HPJ85484.1 hypothetical protein [Bacillota bacterium]HPQ62242.1 hypothetical protein [Bacillota bacterium]HRX91809.1 hypothetical protein [Candidatus Izemoplasmatales bacterium]